MKTKLLVALASALAITATTARAQTRVPAPAYAPGSAPATAYVYQEPTPTRGFLRATVGYTKPATGQYDGTGVFDIGGGVTLGKDEQHEIGLEFLFSSWRIRYFDPNTGRWAGNATISRMPILASYRYYFRIPRSLVSPYIGAGAGLEVVSFTTDLGRGGYYDSWNNYYYYDGNSDSSTAFAAAGTAGIAITLGRYCELDIAYRGMWQGGGNTTVYTNNFYTSKTNNTPSGWVHFVTIGATWRF